MFAFPSRSSLAGWISDWSKRWCSVTAGQGESGSTAATCRQNAALSPEPGICSKKGLPALTTHLESYLKTGYQVCYSPDTETAWDLAVTGDESRRL